MKKLAYNLLILLTIVSLQSCNYDSIVPEVEYVTFAKATYSTGVDPGGTKSFDIPVYTTNVSSAARTFSVSVDPTSNAASGSYTVPSSVSIPAGSNEGKITINLTDTNLGIGVNNLILKFEAGDNYFVGKTTKLAYIQNCTEVTATLSIVFDGYGSETGWNIKDALGGVVTSKAAGTYADGQASATQTITLCAGRDYTFTITDSYGDGLSYPANGTFTLTVGGTVKVTGGGDFGSSNTTAFNTK